MRALPFFLALALVACPPMPNTQDAGRMVDNSCGVDCEAQRHYGLIANRCYEYSDSPTSAQATPVLGAWVKPVFTLEGNVPVMPVEYRVSGLLMMKDSFAFADCHLWLMWRDWPMTSESVTYKNEASAIVGIKWLESDSVAGETVNSSAKADVVTNMSGAHTVKDSTFRTSLAEPSATELRTPLENFASGLTLVLNESPDNNGIDPQRIFVPERGFVVIQTSLQRTGGSALRRYLQAVRDIGTPDSGSSDCGI